MLYFLKSIWLKQYSFVTKRTAYIKMVALTIGILWYASSGFMFFERPGKPELLWSDALWWSLVTMTTVGYGDYFPVTLGGKYLIGFPIMIFGIGLIGFIISEAAKVLIQTYSKKLKGMMDITWENHILIINFTNTEQIIKITNELQSDESTKNKRICLIDNVLTEIPNELVELGIGFVKGNPTFEETLTRANVKQATHAIILVKNHEDPHSDDQNLTNILVMENMQADIITIVEVLSPEKTKHFQLAGSDHTVCISDITTNLMVQELQDPGIKDVIQEMLSNTFGQQIYLVPIKQMKEWKYKELLLWSVDNDYTTLGLVRDGQPMLNCPNEESVNQTDRAIMIGSERIQELSIGA